jgi:hypothetical protein
VYAVVIYVMWKKVRALVTRQYGKQGVPHYARAVTTTCLASDASKLGHHRSSSEVLFGIAELLRYMVSELRKD